MATGDEVRASARFLDVLPRDLTSSLDPKVILSSLAAGASRILNATRCSVVRVDLTRHPGRGFVFAAVDDPAIDGYSLDLENYPEIQEALLVGRPILVRDEPGDPIAERIRRRYRSLPFPLSVVLPLRLRGESFGVLFLRFADVDAEVSEEAIELCQLVAFGAAVALANAREYEELVAEVQRREHHAHQVEEAHRLRMEVLAAASHDLRTPLNSIFGYVDLLVEGAYGELPAEQREILIKVTDNAGGLLQIVNTLIDHARLEEGKVPVTVTRGEIPPLLEELRITIEPLAIRRPVDVSIESRSGFPTVATDWLKLKRILLNLMHNALKFTDVGRVTLTAWSEDGQIVFEIADTGPGIAEENLPHIFTQFYRVAPTRADGPGGLGLTIVKRYCDMIGARIEVASRPGQGTRFIVRVPAEWRGEVPSP